MNQVDREKVIKDLLDIREDYEDQRCEVSVHAIENAITMLKDEAEIDKKYRFYVEYANDLYKQLKELKEEVPAEIESEGSASWYVCGRCSTAIDSGDKYCRACGRKLYWL